MLDKLLVFDFPFVPGGLYPTQGAGGAAFSMSNVVKVFLWSSLGVSVRHLVETQHLAAAFGHWASHRVLCGAFCTTVQGLQLPAPGWRDHKPAQVASTGGRGRQPFEEHQRAWPSWRTSAHRGRWTEASLPPVPLQHQEHTDSRATKYFTMTCRGRLACSGSSCNRTLWSEAYSLSDASAT